MSPVTTVPDVIVSQPTSLVTDQVVMFGNAAVLRP
jgi:hypothetical protein